MNSNSNSNSAPDFDVIYATEPNSTRDQAIRLLRNGTVTDETSFGELSAILAADEAA